ncbi:PadR family transcriptional regulator [Nonomuraea sp. NPDC050547]|uniref:PadR family transcriptional regulator n=1 Tax=Nonomuraea sp. NPDC050547 TaxID=3364368 RepID=UPI00379DCA7E
MSDPPPASRIRMTTPTRLVLDLLVAADPADPPWGYRICERTDLGPGTVYPILERLENAGWITGEWEAATPTDRPRRRVYTLSSVGRHGYAEAQAARKSRSWLPAGFRRAGGTA